MVALEDCPGSHLWESPWARQLTPTPPLFEAAPISSILASKLLPGIAVGLFPSHPSSSIPPPRGLSGLLSIESTRKGSWARTEEPRFGLLCDFGRVTILSELSLALWRVWPASPQSFSRIVLTDASDSQSCAGLESGNGVPVGRKQEGDERRGMTQGWQTLEACHRCDCCSYRNSPCLCVGDNLRQAHPGALPGAEEWG